jgi:HD superfamily phosphohydrolase
MSHHLEKVIDEICAFWQHRAGKTPYAEKDITIQDPIHGAIEVERELVFLLDSVMVQRLRRISQMALAGFVFPGANHTRFEHCLGVMHLVGRILKNLSKTENLTGNQVMEAKAAGLLHDIGHLPFSHALEPLLECDSAIKAECGKLKVKPSELLTMKIVQSDWMRDIFAVVNKRSGRYKLDHENIANLAIGRPPKNLPKFGFLGQLIHGDFDADRIDYLLRDAHYTGVPLGIVDIERLVRTIETSTSMKRKYLVLDVKGLQSFVSMIVARSTMYSAVYFHRGVRAANNMLLRAAYTEFSSRPLELLAGDDISLFQYLSQRKGTAKLIDMLRSRDLFEPALTLKTENAVNSKALEDFVSEGSIVSAVRHETKIDRRIGHKKYAMLDLPRIEAYSEIDADVREKGIVKPLRDWSRIAKGVEDDSSVKWRGYVFGLPGKVSKVRIESRKYLKRLGLEFKGI